MLIIIIIMKLNEWTNRYMEYESNISKKRIVAAAIIMLITIICNTKCVLGFLFFFHNFIPQWWWWWWWCPYRYIWIPWQYVHTHTHIHKCNVPYTHLDKIQVHKIDNYLHHYLIIYKYRQRDGFYNNIPIYEWLCIQLATLGFPFSQPPPPPSHQ